jgi:hypothetical protein
MFFQIPQICGSLLLTKLKVARRDCASRVVFSQKFKNFALNYSVQHVRSLVVIRRGNVDRRGRVFGGHLLYPSRRVFAEPCGAIPSAHLVRAGQISLPPTVGASCADGAVGAQKHKTRQ